MEFLNGQMGRNIKESGQNEDKMKKVRYMILALINGHLANGIWGKKLKVICNILVIIVNI